ncbi:TetR family transcriptional regulator [Micromonospora sp. NPDC051196]|uniref:SbtR family transcriptional regulator n=1 Tax=Micromonospora sp. NPDC051196 TaxID=3155281 RepID=UPI0034150B17
MRDETNGSSAHHPSPPHPPPRSDRAAGDGGAGRDDLVDPVEDFVGERDVDACADAAPALAAAHEPGVALAKWLDRFTAFVATKRGFVAALHSGDPAFDGLPGYLMQKLGPALESLLEAATANGDIQARISAQDLLYAVAKLCAPMPNQEPDYGRRMVALLVDGLRSGESPH